MGDDNKNKDKRSGAAEAEPSEPEPTPEGGGEGEGEALAAGGGALAPAGLPADQLPAAAQLGATRYVMAGLFLAAMAVAYVLGKMLGAIWGRLAEALWFQTRFEGLARVGEDERAEYTTAFGGVVAVALAFYLYRRADVRRWADEVASELSKVTWPDKAEVTNSTVIVIVASAFATVYLALLDYFWGFVTRLVYGG
ncbi:MAG TPA: preprotein translocase subunit SecE [Polyangiaceae bacterium]|nr:preprotein translocase subunit SecE [Polyangiaceae bacterium]